MIYSSSSVEGRQKGTDEWEAGPDVEAMGPLNVTIKAQVEEGEQRHAHPRPRQHNLLNKLSAASKVLPKHYPRTLPHEAGPDPTQ